MLPSAIASVIRDCPLQGFLCPGADTLSRLQTKKSAEPKPDARGWAWREIINQAPPVVRVPLGGIPALGIGRSVQSKTTPRAIAECEPTHTSLATGFTTMR